MHSITFSESCSVFFGAGSPQNNGIIQSGRWVRRRSRTIFTCAMMGASCIVANAILIASLGKTSSTYREQLPGDGLLESPASQLSGSVSPVLLLLDGRSRRQFACGAFFQPGFQLLLIFSTDRQLEPRGSGLGGGPDVSSSPQGGRSSRRGDAPRAPIERGGVPAPPSRWVVQHAAFPENDNNQPPATGVGM